MSVAAGVYGSSISANAGTSLLSQKKMKIAACPYLVLGSPQMTQPRGGHASCPFTAASG